MHEFSLMQEAAAIAVAAAREHGLARVSEVRLAVGRLSGVSVDALHYAWDFLRTTDTLLSTAQLLIEQPTGHGECDGCGFSGEVTEVLPVCPSCHAFGLRLSGGRQFDVLGLSGDAAD